MDSERTFDAAAASMIVERCKPPKVPGVSQSTIKLVLLILRGLGAPGSPIVGCAHELEDRTCLGERAIRAAIALLRDQGMLVQLQTSAPGKAAAYMLEYGELMSWLSDEHREAVEGVITRRGGRPNTGAERRRTPAPRADEHRRSAPPSNATPARGAGTPARGAATPAHSAGDLKEERAIRAKPAAAAAAEISVEEALGLTASAKIPDGMRLQLAQVIAKRRVSDRELALVALERLCERLRDGGVKTPTGLLVSLLDEPDGPEPAQATLKRREAERADARTCARLEQLDQDQLTELASRLKQLLEYEAHRDDIPKIFVGDNFARPILEDSMRHARRWIGWRWDQLTEIPLDQPAHMPGVSS